MSNYDYTKLQLTAARMIDKFGGNAEFTRTTGDSFDPLTGEMTGGTQVVESAKAARLNYSIKEIDGSTVLMSDFRLLVQPVVSPAIDDSVSFDGKSYRVINVIEVKPNDKTIYFDLQVRA